MPYEIRYSDRPQDRHIAKDEALKELKGIVEGGDVDFIQVRTASSVPGGFFLAIFPIPGKLWDDWVTVESEEFVSRDAALNFLREAGLIKLFEDAT